MAVECYLYLEDDQGEQIKGECTDSVFKECIEIFKFDFDAVSQVDPAKMLGEDATPIPKGKLMAKGEKNGEGLSGDVMRSSTTAIQEARDEQTGRDSFTFSVDKTVDAASPSLFQSYCKGTSRQEQDPAFKTAIVYVLVGGMKRDPKAKREQLCILVLEFSNLHITQYQVKYADGLADEKLTFYFDSYLMTYKWQETTGGTGKHPPLGYDFVGSTRSDGKPGPLP
jgi:type VI protein secretion system component Hcp